MQPICYDPYKFLNLESVRKQQNIIVLEPVVFATFETSLIIHPADYNDSNKRIPYINIITVCHNTLTALRSSHARFGIKLHTHTQPSFIAHVTSTYHIDCRAVDTDCVVHFCFLLSSENNTTEHIKNQRQHRNVLCCLKNILLLSTFWTLFKSITTMPRRCRLPPHA